MKLLYITLSISLVCIPVTADRPCAPREFGSGNIVCVCNMTYCDTIAKLSAVPADQFVQYSTSQSGLRFHKTVGSLVDSPHSTGIRFTVNLTATYQRILGFGGAFTDAAGINIDSLALQVKQNLMRSYFSVDGIEFNFGRVPVAGSDFSTHTYTYDDVPGDANFTHYNLTLEDFFYKLMSDKQVAEYIDGIAVHWYWDTLFPPSLLDRTHNNFPDKFILATEASVGDKPWEFEKVKLGSWSRGESYMEDILEDLNHWVTGWIDWNLALNPQGGPNWARNFVDAAIIVNTSANEFYKQPMFYALGHFAKFLPEGSVRIGLQPQEEKGVLAVAFQTPDNAVIIILYSRSDYDRRVTVTVSDTRHINLDIPKRSFHTVITGKVN
ncbi:glucosylceramidase-like isoform X4 [Zootermopsis nevadensis]|uniref:glucosylceramidase-like isoform X4 n=1 Tax=Zootermopsis nevadensis TaxID=136037 RepID=UPI000B8EAC30|nr:glucosylceramidase-like isoform X4 [Zootermopsis nevadensis]